MLTGPLLFSVANVPIGVFFGSRYVRASRAYRETMENVHILFARPLKLEQCDSIGIFQLPSKRSMGF